LRIIIIIIIIKNNNKSYDRHCSLAMNIKLNKLKYYHHCY